MFTPDVQAQGQVLLETVKSVGPAREMRSNATVTETVVIMLMSLVAALVGAALGLVGLFVLEAGLKLKLKDLGILLMFVIPVVVGTLTFILTVKAIRASISSSQDTGRRL